MMEHGNTGDYDASTWAKDILDQYFGYYTWDEEGKHKYDQEGNQVDDDGEILVPAEDLQEEDEDSSAPEAEEPGEETEEPQPTPTPAPSREEGIPRRPVHRGGELQLWGGGDLRAPPHPRAYPHAKLPLL